MDKLMSVDKKEMVAFLKKVLHKFTHVVPYVFADYPETITKYTTAHYRRCGAAATAFAPYFKWF